MENREKLVKNYFTKKSLVRPIIVAIMGLLMLLIGAVTVGILGIIVGGAMIAYNIVVKKAATDSQIDELVEKELEKITLRGLEKMGLDASEVNLISPITIKTYHQKDLNKDDKAYFRTGEDGTLRYSLVKGIVFYFSEKQVYCYTNVVSLASGGSYKETTDEYFYSDIVSVSTVSNSVEEFGKKIDKLSGKVKTSLKKVVYDVESFNLTTSGGTSVSANIRDSNAERIYGGTLEVESTEKKIRAMRNLVRERKTINA